MSSCRECGAGIESGNVLCPSCAGAVTVIASAPRIDCEPLLSRRCPGCDSDSVGFESQYCSSCGSRLPELQAADLLPLIQELQSLSRSASNATLPQTNLLSPDFLTRAFAVYGHLSVAALLIGLPLYLIALLLSLS